MTEIGVLTFAHLLCLVYWLGADLGVFTSSYYVANPALSAETRVNMVKLLFFLDQAPRLCMPLIFATGVHLAARMGWLSLEPSAVWLVWGMCLAWLAMVATLHKLGPRAQMLIKIDAVFRVLLIAALLLIGIAALLEGWFADWIAVKLLVFAGLVSCGLLIRLKLKPFGPAFGKLAAGQVTDQDNAAISRSLNATRPFVVAIWLGLLINTALGLHLL